MITVVAALIKKDNKYLIAQRLKGSLENKWEFPGGKLEPGETEEHALEREIKEEFNVDIIAKEFNVDIIAKEFIMNNVCEYPERTIELRLYLCEYMNDEFILMDHKQYKFVGLDEILDYDLAPADIPLAQYLIGRMK